MVLVQMFKAKIQTKRFKKNQPVWINSDHGNHLSITYRYRGKGRYVKGVLDKWSSNCQSVSKVIGEFPYMKIEVDENFAKKLNLEIITI